MVKEITSNGKTLLQSKTVTKVFIPVETSVAKADVQIEQPRFNYNTLLNKPKINGITIIGDKSGAEYGLTNISVFNKEVLERIEADEDLQRQIDDIETRADVIDVIFKDTDLPNYPTEHLTKDDVIIVLDDTSHEDYLSYYRWTVTEESSSWVYIASDESGYTKAQIDVLLKAITDRLDTAEGNIEQLQTNVENLNTGLTNEINRATGEEQRIEGKVDAEAQTRSEEIERVEGLISAEAQTRSEEDEELQKNIEAEATTRNKADEELQKNINKLDEEKQDNLSTGVGIKLTEDSEISLDAYANDLKDITISDPVNKQLLFFNAITSQWINDTLIEIDGGNAGVTPPTPPVPEAIAGGTAFTKETDFEYFMDNGIASSTIFDEHINGGNALSFA